MNSLLSVSMTDLHQKRKSSVSAVAEAFRNTIVQNPRMPCTVDTPNISDYDIISIVFTPFIGPYKVIEMGFHCNTRDTYLFILFDLINKCIYLDSCVTDDAKKMIGRSVLLPNNHHRLTIKRKENDALEISVDDEVLSQMEVHEPISTIKMIRVHGDLNVKEISTASGRRRKSRMKLKEWM